MAVDLSELQGNVLSAYNLPQAAYVFCRIEDRGAGGAWLRALAGRVTTAAPWESRPAETLNVALSFGGLRALGLPEAELARLPAAFRAGMADRAARLRDRGPDAPEHWQAGLDDRSAHVVVSLHVADPRPAALDAALARLATPAGVRVVTVERTAVLPAGREHFGYGDALAQPAIADDVAGPYHGHGTPASGRRDGVDRWAPVAPGEFVLGYPDEDGEVPTGPPPLDRDATYMVVRKLQQHVAAWERQLRRWAYGDPVLAERLGAQVVGRWKNGTPLASHPDAPHPALDARVSDLTPAQRRERFALLNDFRFAGDAAGARCPVGAHVRRANPRDALGDGRLTRRHRLVRRGMPYGPPASDAERVDDTGSPERGLLFVCFQASLARQFELVQGDWLSDGDVFGLGAQADALMSSGAPDGHLLVGGSGGGEARLLVDHDRTVTLRGGGYFIVPSVSGLRALAGG